MAEQCPVRLAWVIPALTKRHQPAEAADARVQLFDAVYKLVPSVNVHPCVLVAKAL